jgi:catechol 2,3-dioxygenase-like lactoylglutathione lyase family enzyme
LNLPFISNVSAITTTMPRGLHHVTHSVRDLEALAAAYRRLGFTVGARNQHAWGTHNRIVQLDGFYIELLEVAEPEKIVPHGIVPHGSRSFSFGAFNRDFVARQEGIAMLALESRDANADAAAFRAAGIGDFDIFSFEREARRPDGAAAKVAFSLVFANDRQSPDIGFFACQEHHPENFWNPAFQTHSNGAATIAAVVLVAENPTDHHIFLSAFVGERDIQASSTGITVPTPRGAIQVMDQAAFRIQFGVEPPDVARGARMAALRIAVRDFAAAVTAVQAGGIVAQMRMGRIVVGPEVATGATLVFEPAG